VSQPLLDRSGVVAVVGELEAAGVPEHVRVDGEGEAGLLADGGTLLVVDDGDGQAIGRVLGPTSIEYCYTEGGADAQAYCRVLTKSR
jgi:hypothetical protein